MRAVLSLTGEFEGTRCAGNFLPGMEGTQRGRRRSRFTTALQRGARAAREPGLAAYAKPSGLFRLTQVKI